jgi:hypothetical protein
MSETAPSQKLHVPFNFNFKMPEIPCVEKIPIGLEDGKPLWESTCDKSQGDSASKTLKDLWERLKALLKGCRE